MVKGTPHLTINNTLEKSKRMETVQFPENEIPGTRPREPQPEPWRRACGCVRTSDKLRQILDHFPKPPPPTPATHPSGRLALNYVMRNEIMPPDALKQGGVAGDEMLSNLNYLASSYEQSYPINGATTLYVGDVSKMANKKTTPVECPQRKVWHLLTDLLSLIQLSVVATALAIYYLIYCYMQLVYYTLRSAVYFHHADGPMKVTIAVVTVTSIIIGLHFISRFEKFLKIV